MTNPSVLPAPLLALLQQPPVPAAPLPDLAAWWPCWQRLHAEAAAQAPRSSAMLAIACGAAADRIGWAFAGGYQAALRALHPALWAGDAMAALCVTEATGNRPRDIQTRIEPQPDGTLRVSGAKRWTTLGPQSAVLLVAGRWIDAGGADPAADAAGPSAEPVPSRPSLRVLRIDSRAPGITLEAMPPTPFVPEVPHARVLLSNVSVPGDTLLPGDGYTDWVKPFRTIEDVHVTLAVGSYLLAEARRRGWPAGFVERLLATLVPLAALAGHDPSAPATHLVLAGTLQALHGLVAEAGPLWPAGEGDATAQRWRRDVALLQVAQTARTQRAERAWQALSA